MTFNTSGLTYSKLKKWCIAEREAAIEELVTLNDIVSINRTQGKIIVFDQILTMPEQVEIEAAIKDTAQSDTVDNF